MQFFNPANWFEAREALVKAGRQESIGPGCHMLIPFDPPKEVLLPNAGSRMKAMIVGPLALDRP